MLSCRNVIAALLAILALPPGAAGEGVIVTDGDSLKIDGERIRLWGVDAPELGQKCEWRGQSFDCGRAAKDELIRLTQGRPVECRKVDTDRHGRTVARCEAGGEDLAATMVRTGWALDYARYSRGAYAAAEEEARQARRGLWDEIFTPPWEWRAEQRRPHP